MTGSKIHIYANNSIVSYLYDRSECRPAGGSGDYRCDMFLTEILDSERIIWVIERKDGQVDSSLAGHASDQIDACIQVLNAPRGWRIQKCVIAKSFTHESLVALKRDRIYPLHFDLNRHNDRDRDIINAIKQLQDH